MCRQKLQSLLSVMISSNRRLLMYILLICHSWKQTITVQMQAINPIITLWRPKHTVQGRSKMRSSRSATMELGLSCRFITAGSLNVLISWTISLRYCQISVCTIGLLQSAREKLRAISYKLHYKCASQERLQLFLGGLWISSFCHHCMNLSAVAMSTQEARRDTVTTSSIVEYTTLLACCYGQKNWA